MKKAASVDSKTSKLKWPTRHKQHEELTQLKISDRPCKTTITIASDNHEEEEQEKEEQEQDDQQEEENKGVQQGGGDIQTTLSAFAYASTPPPPISKRQSQLLAATHHSTTKEGSNNKWKNRLSLIRPTAASFLKLNNNSTSNTAAIIHGS